MTRTRIVIFLLLVLGAIGIYGHEAHAMTLQSDNTKACPPYDNEKQTVFQFCEVADTDNTWYLGIGTLFGHVSDVPDYAGPVYRQRSTSRTPPATTKPDKSGFGFRVYGGKSDIVELPFGAGVGAEVGYASIKADVSALDLSALISSPTWFNTVVFLRYGAAYWNIHDQSDINFVSAIGSKYQATSWGGRLEYIKWHGSSADGVLFSAYRTF